MDAKNHWEKIYSTKAPDAVSWYRAHLETSLALIERAASAHSQSRPKLVTTVVTTTPKTAHFRYSRNWGNHLKH
jgi:hypothetical protein